MAENEEIILDIKVNGDNSIKSLKEEIKGIKNELIGLDPASEAFAKAAAKAGELQDKLNDANEAVKELAAGSKLEQFGNVLGSLKDKILSLDFAGAKEKAKQLAEVSKSFSLKDAIQSVKDLGGTFVQLGKALLTNPLFLIAGVIAAAVYAFSQMPSQAEKTAEAVEKINVQLELEVYYLEQANKLREIDRNTEVEIAKIRGASAEEILRLQNEQNKARKEENEEILRTKREELANLQTSLAQADVQGRRTGDYKLYNQELEKNNKLVDEINALEVERKKITGDIKINQEKINAELRKQAEEGAKQAADAFKEAADKAQKQREKEIEAYRKQKEEEERILKEAEQRKQDFLKSERIKFQNEENQANDEQIKSNDDFLLSFQAIQRQANQEKIDNDKATNDKIKENADKAYKEQLEQRDKDLEDFKENQDRKKELASSAISILSEIGSLFAKKNEKDAKKAFEINKAFSLSTAIANTGLAIVNALTAGGNPIKLATGAQFVDAAIAGTIGAINIAKIASTKFEGGSSSSGGVSSSSSSSASSTVLPADTTLFGTAGAFNSVGGGAGGSGSSQGQGTIQAVVIGQNVTNQQQQDAAYQQAFTLSL